MAIKAQEIIGKNSDELKIMLREKRAQLVQDRFGASARQLKNVKRIAELKRDIARILTILGQRKREDQKKAAKGEIKQDK